MADAIKQFLGRVGIFNEAYRDRGQGIYFKEARDRNDEDKTSARRYPCDNEKWFICVSAGFRETTRGNVAGGNATGGFLSLQQSESDPGDGRLFKGMDRNRWKLKGIKERRLNEIEANEEFRIKRQGISFAL